jgi:hypothetical protein
MSVSCDKKPQISTNFRYGPKNPTTTRDTTQKRRCGQDAAHAEAVRKCLAFDEAAEIAAAKIG